MEQQPIIKNYLELKEAAEFLGVKVARLKGWAYNRRVPAYKLGKTILFKREDLIAFIQPM